MPIIADNIKLLASARMTDTLDGGGQMAGTALQDGVDNNIYPDVSSINRVQGALQFRKVYPGVLQAGADALLSAHVLLEDAPDDPAVSALLMPAASALQTVSELTAVMNAAGEAFGFYGASKTTAEVPANSNSIPVAGTRCPLIPKTTLSIPVGGSVVESGVLPTVDAWVDSGQTVTLVFDEGGGSTFLSAPNSVGVAQLDPSSVTGTFTHPTEGAGTVASNADATSVVFTAGAFVRVLSASVSTDMRQFSGPAFGVALTAVSISARVLVSAALPRQLLRFPVVEGQVTYTLSVPSGVARHGEVLRFTATSGLATERSARSGSDVFTGAGLNFGQLNRATGTLTLVFPAPLVAGTFIEFSFALASYATPLLPAALVSGGLFTGNTAAVTPAAGNTLTAAAFSIAGGEAYLILYAGVVRAFGGVVRGSATGAGVLTVPGNDGRSISGWYGVQSDPNVGVSRLDAVLPLSIQGTTLTVTGETSTGTPFSATASAAGVFATAQVTGTYDATTGALSLVFAAPVKLQSLEYAGLQEQPQSVFAPIWGLDPAQFPADGTVAVLRAGQVMALRHTATVAAATYSNGNTINCGRLDLSDVRLVGANGRSTPTGWTVDLAAGVVSVVDVSGWSQPVTVRHSIEHLSVALSVPNTGAVVLGRKTTRAFPVGSVLSSALVLGDFQARVSVAFSQETLTPVWSDTRVGSPITPQYQQAANPIVVRNDGAVTERWAFIFTSSTTFRLVGETLGQVAVGDVNTDFAPINPVLGQPYMTVRKEGWGAGWSNGNVLRINTFGAHSPVWGARVVLPSEPSTAPDSITVAVRGDIDA